MIILRCKTNEYLQTLLDDNHPQESFRMLQALSGDATRSGLNSDTIVDYCRSITNFCMKKLTEKEKMIANRALHTIETRTNTSGTIKNLEGTNAQK